jgi:NAD(P)-dependent dehydrogenase (short-subunit alcohol dehydrogenase family)
MTDRGWALVTGGARRLGRVLSLRAAAAGFDVLVHARSPADAEETVAAVRGVGRRAESLGGDLSDPAAAMRMIAEAPAPSTLLINCASLFERDAIETLTAAGFDAAYAVNLRAPLLLSQAFAAALPPDRLGLIVNILDQRVWRLNPLFFSYTITKSALWTATQTLAQALAPRIRVNAIGPGPTLASTHQTAEAFAAEAAETPLGQPIDPAEIAGALAFLIDAPSVTGQMIAVDGGQHLAWRTPDVLNGL